MFNDYLTVKQTAAQTGLEAKTILARITKGLIKAEKFGGSIWVIPTDEVERLKKEPKRGAHPLRGRKGKRRLFIDQHKGAYNSWRGMITRCTNPRANTYEGHGGRGIRVCERWLVFENFLEDMGDRPQGLTIERLDNDGNYEPGNCKWATWSEQNLNKGRRS